MSFRDIPYLRGFTAPTKQDNHNFALLNKIYSASSCIINFKFRNALPYRFYISKITKLNSFDPNIDPRFRSFISK